MEEAAQGDKPKTLQNIAYISIPDNADLDFLLWDLQDAIAAYARLSGTALPCPLDLGANIGGDAADGIVFAVEDVFDDEAMAAVEQTLDCLGTAETRVYAVVQAAYANAGQAHVAVSHLREACKRRELSWCGGVIVCAGSGIAALRHSPRMGLLRRPFSEAIDMLVGAVRMGCSVEYAQRLSGSNAENVNADGTAFAEPAVPAPIWRATIKRLGTRTQSKI